MADEKPKYQFRRRIDDIKDIVYDTYGGDPQKISSFLGGIEQIVSLKDLFSQQKKSVNIGNNNSLFSVNLNDLKDGHLSIDESSFSTHLFPSDLIRAFANVATIFVKKDSNLAEFAKGEFVKIKKLGDYNSDDQTIDEVAFLEHFDEIERMHGQVINAYRAHKNLLDTTKQIEKLTPEELKKLKAALEKKEKTSQVGAVDDSSDQASPQNPKQEPQQESHQGESPNGAVVPGNDGQTAKNIKTTPTTDQKNKIQYETGWLYNRAVYEMFTAHGIKANDINPALLEKLRTDIYKFTAEIPPEKLVLMLGSASKRQNALYKFYPTFASNNKAEINNFYSEIASKSSYNDLNDKQRAEFLEFHNTLLSDKAAETIGASRLLKKSINEITGKDGDLLNNNVKNTLDAMILQYGIDQEFIDENGKVINLGSVKNNYDVIRVIEGMSPDKVKIVFGLTGNLSTEQIDQFKKTITSYTTYRASELTFHIQDTSLSKGLMGVKADSEITPEHQNFLSSTRIAVSKNGAETVIAGLESKTDKDISSRRREKIDKLNKQYKSFIPLWGNLQPEEQRIVYKKFGIPFNASNKDAALEFIPEFLFFDVSSLRTFKNIRGSDKLSAEEVDAALLDYENFKNNEYFEVSDLSFSAEQMYGQFINDSYLYSMEPDQVLRLADFLNDGEALGEYPSASFFDNYSSRELMENDQYVQDSGYQLSRSNSNLTKINNFSKNIKNSRVYKGLAKRFGKNKLNPAKKLGNALEKSAEAKVFEGVSAVSDLILPGSGRILYTIGKTIGFKKTMAIAGSLLGLLIAKTLYALSTVGGLIGGLVGGVAGFFLGGGPVGIIPGVIVGANIGEAIYPANWFNSLFGGKGAGTPAGTSVFVNPSANSAVIASQASEAALLAETSGVFFGLPIFLLAPGIATFIAVVVTAHTVFTIQSAFLIPLPNNLSGEGLILGDLACFQLMPGGTSIDAGAVTLTSLDWDQASIDLFKGGLAEVAANSTWVGLLCKGGPISLYKFPSHPSGYFGWVKDANTMILYEGAFLNAAQMEYLVSHETAHIIDHRNSDLLGKFLKVLSTNDCFTYPIPSMCGDGEAFAEGISLYVTSDRFVGNQTTPAGPWPFKQNYSGEYNWIKQNIFGGTEYQ